MKTFKMAAIFAAAVLCLVGASFAEETEGLIPRLLKKWFPDTAKKIKADIPYNTAIPGMSGSADPLAGDIQKAMSALPEAVTQEQMILEIKDMLGSDEELLTSMPDVKRLELPDKSITYTFCLNEKHVELEDMSFDALEQALNRMNEKQAMINWQMLKDQQDVMRQARSSQAPRPPQLPQRPPEIPPQAPPSPAGDRR